MLNSLVSYQFEDNPVRVVDILGDPWFAASDVAAVLGYRDAGNMIRNLDDDEKGTHNMSTLGGNQTLTIISESGLYAAIFKSRREEALRFRKWVTSEVLPAIRKTGRFVMHEADPGDIPALGDEGIAELTAKVGLIREARQVWGRHVVQSIWISIGLPAPIAISEVVDHGDPMLPEIKNFISDRDEVTMGELHDALGIPHNRRSNATSRRIGEAMRLIGWRRIVAKRAGAVTRVWVSPAKLGTLAAKGE